MVCEFLPKFMWFENDNPYSENEDEFNYMIIPDLKEETMTVKIWYGEYCLEKSTVVEEKVFPFEAASIEPIVAYIREQYTKCLDNLYGEQEHE